MNSHSVARVPVRDPVHGRARTAAVRVRVRTVAPDPHLAAAAVPPPTLVRPHVPDLGPAPAPALPSSSPDRRSPFRSTRTTRRPSLSTRTRRPVEDGAPVVAEARVVPPSSRAEEVVRPRPAAAIRGAGVGAGVAVRAEAGVVRLLGSPELRHRRPRGKIVEEEEEEEGGGCDRGARRRGAIGLRHARIAEGERGRGAGITSDRQGVAGRRVMSRRARSGRRTMRR